MPGQPTQKVLVAFTPQRITMRKMAVYIVKNKNFSEQTVKSTVYYAAYFAYFAYFAICEGVFYPDLTAVHSE